MNTAGVRYRFHGFELDPGRRTLVDPDGESITLRTKVFDTLLVLVTEAGRPVSKSELIQAVWTETVVEENNLNQAISALRQALSDDHNAPRFVATITGRGYQFVAPVEAVESVLEAPEDSASPKPRFRWTVAALVLLVVTLALAAALKRAAIPDPFAQPERTTLESAEPLTQVPGTHRSPTLSPDGTLMAFVSDRSGSPQIWVKGLPDRAARQLTFGDAPATSPSWSPVDDTIVFQRAADTGRQAIWAVDALGTEPPRVIFDTGWRPRFAADGRRITYDDGGSNVYIGELDTGTATLLEGAPQLRGFAAATPAMNANGDIVFALADEGPSGNLWLYRADDQSFVQLTKSTGALAGVWARSPSWLPDNTHVVYSAAETDPANSHLWRINTRTGEQVQITGGSGGYDTPEVSRDGRHMVYAQSRALFGIVATDPETGEHTPLFETRGSIALPVVAPDGNQLVFFGDSIFTMPTKAGAPRALTSGDMGRATLPTWSRSGDAIFYYLDRTLHKLDPETAQSTLVLDDFHWSKQNWLAAHDDLIAYRVNSVIPGRSGTVLHDLRSGDVQSLDDRLIPMDFTRSGDALMGRLRQTYEIVICPAPDFACTPVMDGDTPASGAIPRWSHDEQRIYYRRARSDKPGYAKIWVIDRDGGPAREVTEIGPYDPRSVFFGISADDQIIWNRYDPGGNAELWRVPLIP